MVAVAGSLSGSLGEGVVAVVCLWPLPGLGAEGNGSVKSRCGGNRPRVSLGESRVRRKNMFPFPSLFHFPLPLQNNFSKPRKMQIYKKKDLFLENFTSFTFFFPCVAWLGDSSHHFGCELGCLSPVLGKAVSCCCHPRAWLGVRGTWCSGGPLHPLTESIHHPKWGKFIHLSLDCGRVSNSGLQLKVCSGFPFPCSSFYSTFPFYFIFFFFFFFSPPVPQKNPT
ncbi:hypothetical protein Nmel_018744, partial [Mimus melanotis]